jgi:hypothetical protein
VRAEQADGSGCGGHWAEAKMADVEKDVILIAVHRSSGIAVSKTSNGY